MRPCIPFLTDIDGDNAEHIMSRSGEIVGWDREHFIVRYGFMKGSENAERYGVSSDGFTFVICDLVGNIEERLDGILGCTLPAHFLKILEDPMREIERPDQAMLDEHAQWLTEQSREICEMNKCTEDEHNCESYSYYKVTRNKFGDITDFDHIDVCTPDFITQQTDCALPLPFEGDGNEFLEELDHYSD